MYLYDPICNVLNFSVFDHTSCGKHYMLCYGVEETDSIDGHDITEDGDLLVLIKYGYGNACYLNGIHMLYLAPHCLAFSVWYDRPIDTLSHSHILSQDWKVLQDFIINCIEDSIYRMTSDVLESPCTDRPLYIAGGVSLLLVLQFWYWGIGVVNHDVRILVL